MGRERIGNLQNNQLLKDSGFRPWIMWYAGILPVRNETPNSYFGEKLDLRIALETGEWWKRAPAKVNAEIANWLKQTKDSARLKKAVDPKIGRIWEPHGQQFVASTAEQRKDRAVAKQPATLELLAGIERRSVEFRPIGLKIEETYGWEGFTGAYQRFARACAEANRTGQFDPSLLYDYFVEFGSFVEMDLELKRERAGNVTALTANDRRAYSELVRASSTWIRRFPSALLADESAGRFFNRLDAALAATTATLLATSAADAGLISDADRALMTALLAALSRAGLPAEKAAERGYFSVRNLTIAVAMFILGGGAEKTDLYGRATDWVASRANEITEIVKDLPADLRGIVGEMLEDAEKRREENAGHNRGDYPM